MHATAFFTEMLEKRRNGAHTGIYSVCSANPYVLRAAIEQGAEDGAHVLIEATANQVNQFGGYTGMKPGDFYDFVYGLAAEYGFPSEDVILGGDHLGPLVWKDKTEPEAMALAEELVAAYVSAGFSKIHLDTSMKLAGDSADAPLSDETIALRGARLCAAAEKACIPGKLPVYVLGSEVPTPGGSREKMKSITPTAPCEFLSSYRAYKDAFLSAGLSGAFSRVVAFVVQPGVEFNDNEVFEYDRSATEELCQALCRLPEPLVFEGHSTDYQTAYSLKRLVEDGVAILKVGPALTYALHCGIKALEDTERALAVQKGLAPSRFTETLEEAMFKNDVHWKNYYPGTPEQQRMRMRFSLFDRARYYLSEPEVDSALKTLILNIEKTGAVSASPDDYLISNVRDCLKAYSAAVQNREMVV